MEYMDITEQLKLLAEEKKECILSSLKEITEKVEKGLVLEYVGCYIETTGAVEVDCCVKDRVSAIGIIESGKHVLLTEQNREEITTKTD